MQPEDRTWILIVDDRSDKLLALTTVLEGIDAEIDTATSGEQALRKLLKRDYAVILLDVHMPTLDGFETAALIRRRKRSEHTPIIFVTAVSDTETHVTRGYELGAVDYIFQPVMTEILKAKVAAFVDLYRRTEDIKRQELRLRREAEQRAEALEMRLQGLLNNLEVGVFQAGLDDRIFEANPAFLRLLGVETLTDLSRLDLGWLSVKARGIPRSPLDLNADPGFRETEVQITRADGAVFWGSLTRRVVMERAESVHIDGLLADVTARKRAELALVEKAEELARSNADLERFAYLASHDLKEPLRMITIYAQLLERRYGDQLDDEGRLYLNYAASGARRMQEMVRDLLRFSQLRTRNHKMNLTSCEEIVDRALFNLNLAVEESGAEITRDPMPTVNADGVLLVHVFQNLIGNAIKFRADRVPRIHIGAQPIDGGWEFSVSDNGIGIQPKDTEVIFEIFRRLHPRERYDGTGIGLSVCRHIVERHRGRIWVDPSQEEGTTFRFTICTGGGTGAAADATSEQDAADAAEGAIGAA